MAARRAPRALSTLPALAIVAGLVAAGCGTRQLMLSVDVLSFIDPSMRSASFDTPVPVPTTITQTVQLVPDERVTLFQGLSNLTSNPHVTVEGRAVIAATRDSGTAILKVYVSEEGTDPRTTQPLVSQPVSFRAGVPDTVSLALASGASANDDRIAELITHSAAQLAVDVEVTLPAGTAPAGSVTITQLTATVVADRPSL